MNKNYPQMGFLNTVSWGKVNHRKKKKIEERGEETVDSALPLL